MRTCTVIGRDPVHCQIVVDNGVVGRRHASIELTDDGGALLVDLSSTNGTFVAGERIDRRVLRPGDVIALGRNTPVAFEFRAACQVVSARHERATIVQAPSVPTEPISDGERHPDIEVVRKDRATTLLRPLRNHITIGRHE